MSSPPSGNPVSAPVGARPVRGGGPMSCAAPGPALALDATAHRQGYTISRLADRSLAN